MTRTPNLIRPESTLLLIIDIQERLIPQIHEADRAEAMSRRMIEAVHIIGVPVLVTERYPKSLGPTVPGVAEAFGDAPVLEKATFSCLSTPEISGAIRATERETLVLVGIEAHVCVLQTALEALDRGYVVHVVADAVSWRHPADADLGLQRMRRAGAQVMSSEMTIFELVHGARSPHFRTVD